MLGENEFLTLYWYQYLVKAVRFPTVYNTEKAITPPKKRDTEPRIERQIPMTKQAIKPFTRVPQLNVDDSTT